MSRTLPRRLHLALGRFELDSLAVLDLGCGPGTYLRHFGPGSVGLDLDPTIAQDAGLDARPWNFVDGIPNALHGRFDRIWCSNLLEHVLAPHEFLIEIRQALRPHGKLLVVVPQTTTMTAGPWRGYLAADHVNFFTARTLARTIERAGYALEFLGNTAVPSWAPNWASQAARIMGPTLLASALPVPGFQYSTKAHKELVDGRILFR